MTKLTLFDVYYSNQYQSYIDFDGDPVDESEIDFAIAPKQLDLAKLFASHEICSMGSAVAAFIRNDKALIEKWENELARLDDLNEDGFYFLLTTVWADDSPNSVKQIYSISVAVYEFERLSNTDGGSALGYSLAMLDKNGIYTGIRQDITFKD